MIVQRIATAKAVGKLLFHDVTKIEKDVFKGPLFKKGHCIREEDIPLLLDLGKKYIYAIELEEGDLHEDDAGLRIARAVQGCGLAMQGPSEGRFNLIAESRGLLKIDVEKLEHLNQLDHIVVSTLHNNVQVEKGEKVAGAKVIPLVVSEDIINKVESICSTGPVISITPYQKLKMGLLITGHEVAEGRIRDGFAPVLQEKASFYDLEQPVVRFAADEAVVIASGIIELIDSGCDLVVVTGGMSVDPDDVTPAGIIQAGADVIKYGAPVLPGAMFMLAYRGSVPIIGLPACAIYYRTTVFDLVFPRLLSGEKVTAAAISKLGHGGLCRICAQCVFPRCSFGKI